MIDTFLMLLMDKEKIPMHQYQCTPKQLKVAREVFVPCIGEKHFVPCYEASIREYCTVKATK